MKYTETPFTPMWFGVDLGDYRPINATYGGVEFDLLPKFVPHKQGAFAWLTNQKEDFTKNKKWQEKLDKVLTSLPETLLKSVPDTLVAFMTASKLHDLVPSCTACYFDLPEKATPFTWLGEKGYIFHFYRDQQDCLFWYFYIRENGEYCILTTEFPFYSDEDMKELTTNYKPEEYFEENLFYTAETFEEFIYRTWIENIIWFDMEGDAMVEGEDVKKAAKDYLAEYLKNQGRSKDEIKLD